MVEADTETKEVDFETRLNTANQTVKNYSLGSMAVGLIPIPVIDLAGLTAVQLKMLHSLANQYDIPFSKELAKSIVASLLGGLLPVSAVKWTASSLAKLIPLGGTVVGITGTVLFGGAATYAVGKIFIQHFESGGTFLDFDPVAVREHFAKEFENGKEQTQSYYQQEPAAS